MPGSRSLKKLRKSQSKADASTAADLLAAAIGKSSSKQSVTPSTNATVSRRNSHDAASSEVMTGTATSIRTDLNPHSPASIKLLPPSAEDTLPAAAMTPLTHRLLALGMASINDDTSASEYSVEEDLRPVVGRASSVRVSKPQIIQHKHTRRDRLRGTNIGLAISASESDTDANLQPGALPSMAEESSGRLSLESLPSDGAGNAVNEPIADARASTDTLTPPKPQQETSDAPMSADKSSTVNNIDGLPTGSTFRSVHPSSVNADAPAASVEGGQLDAEPELGIDRANSSPLPRPGNGLSRRVSIRPSDLVIRHLSQRSNFRESVVTTPYPDRKSSDVSSTNFDPNEGSSEKVLSEDTPEKVGQNENEKLDLKSTKSEKAKKDKRRSRVAFQRAPGSRDRFPSPERPEVLFLELNLARHPCAQTTIEIQVADKSTFDDERLFEQIRTAYYKQLLGPRKLAFLLVRRISHISSEATDLNIVDFIKHLQTPSLGHKRKAWVIWLRANNSSSASTLTCPPPVRQIDNLNRLSLRTRGIIHGHSRRGSRDKNNDDTKRFSTASDASSFHFVYSPAIPRLPFLSSTQKEKDHSPTSPVNATVGSPCRSFFWPSDLSASLSTASRIGHDSTSRRDSEVGNKITTISVYHKFRTGVIVLLTLLNILSAVLSAVLWVVFGVPGTRPGMDGKDSLVRGIPSLKTDWRIDARARVLTGVVIGIAVLIFGALMEGALIWGAWLLL